MIDDDAGPVGDVDQVESPDARQRVNVLIEFLLENESLSDEARSVLRHLQESPRNLVAMNADELGTVLLEGLS